jgi:hypothetical protein
VPGGSRGRPHRLSRQPWDGVTSRAQGSGWHGPTQPLARNLEVAAHRLLGVVRRAGGNRGGDVAVLTQCLGPLVGRVRQTEEVQVCVRAGERAADLRIAGKLGDQVMEACIMCRDQSVGVVVASGRRLRAAAELCVKACATRVVDPLGGSAALHGSISERRTYRSSISSGVSSGVAE